MLEYTNSDVHTLLNTLITALHVLTFPVLFSFPLQVLSRDLAGRLYLLDATSPPSDGAGYLVGLWYNHNVAQYPPQYVTVWYTVIYINCHDSYTMVLLSVAGHCALFTRMHPILSHVTTGHRTKYTSYFLKLLQQQGYVCVFAFLYSHCAQQYINFSFV